MTQKDAVFNAITQVFASNSISFTPNATNVAGLLTRELRSQINARLVTDFSSGSVELSDDAKSKLENVLELRAYISGLVSNWVRKDPRLNGGNIVATTSSSTSSVSKVLRNDAQLQALRKLHAAQVDSSKQAEIQGHIEKRISELTK